MCSPADLDGYMTIAEAARQAGYYSRSGLSTAAKRGLLRTVRLAEGRHLTRREWVEAYMAGLDKRGACHRGREKNRW